jgi:hypothetical protein
VDLREERFGRHEADRDDRGRSSRPRSGR